jgi:tRNA(adenine34) deaminase
MRKTSYLLLVIIIGVQIILFPAGCRTIPATPSVDKTIAEKTVQQVPAWQIERDYISMLAAYAVVYKSWQPENKRGYNIGSVLLDKDTVDGKLVFWAYNCNNITENETQHGEVRLMLGYLAKLHAERKLGKSVPNIKNLDGYTIYTTLEPCAQCAGMMTLQKVKRTIYGQTDPGFGKAIERLKLDSTKLENGYGPYPRPVISERSITPYADLLEKACEKYMKDNGEVHITSFLKSEPAHMIFKQAYEEFKKYTVKEQLNDVFLLDARKLLDSVPAEYIPLNPDI